MKTLSIFILFVFAINTNTNFSKVNTTTIATLDPLSEVCHTNPYTGETICIKINIPRQG